MNKTFLTVLSILSIFLFTFPGFAADRIDVGTTAAVGGEQAIIPVTIENDVPIVAFSFGLVHDPALLTPVDMEYAGPIVPDFLATSSEPEGHTIGVVFDYELNNLVPAGGPRLVAFASYQVNNTASVSNFATVIPGTVGNPPIDPEFSDGTGNPVTPLVEGGGIGILSPLPTGSPGDLGPVIRATLYDESNGTARFVTLDADTGAILSSTPLSTATCTSGTGTPVTDVLVDRQGLTWTCIDWCELVTQIDSNGNVSAEIATGADPLALIGLSGEKVGITHADGTLQVVYSDGTVLFGGDGVGDSAEDGLLGPALLLDGATAFDEAAPGSGNSSWLGGGERLIRLRPNGNVVADRLMAPGQSIVDLAQGPDGSVFVLTTNFLEHRAADGSLIASTELLAARLPLAMAMIPTNLEGTVIEEAVIAITSQGGSGDSLLTVYLTSSAGFELALDAPILNGVELSDELAFVSSGCCFKLLMSGVDANGDGVVYLIAEAPVVQETFVGEKVFINAASTAVPVSTYFGSADFDGDNYSNLSELLAGSSPVDSLQNPTDVIPGFVAPLTDLVASVVEDPADPLVKDVSLVFGSIQPGGFSVDSFEFTRTTDGVAQPPISVEGTATSFTELNVPPGTHVYQGVVIIGGNASDPLEAVVTIGTGEVEQEVPIDVPYEFTEIFDITVNPTAPEDGARYYCTDSANGQIYALDANYLPVAIIPSPFPAGVPCTGIAYVRTGDSNNGSLVIGNGQSGVQMHLIEITLAGDFIRDYFLFVPVPFGSKALLPGAVEGSAGGMGYDEEDGTLYITDVGTCEILGMAHGGSGEIDPAKSFGHPNEGSSQKGCTTKRCQLNNGFVGCTSTILLTSQTEDGTLEIIEVSVDNGVATQIGEGISIAGIEDPGGIVIEGGSITVTGNSDGTVYEVQATGSFTRGDANVDLLVDIGDVITILDYLFSQGAGPECQARMDVNDDNALDIGDGIYLLNSLFVSGSPNPPEPFGSYADLVTGPDPTPDSVNTPCP